jgi:hypothetical protein
MQLEKVDSETFGGSGRVSIETPFRDLIGDSIAPAVPFPDRYSHYAAL